MRSLLVALLASSIAACDCGSYPAGDPGGDEPPPPATCAGLDAEPAPIHDLAAAGAIGFELSVCGHLLARVDETYLLAGPDLGGLSALPAAGGFTDRQARFSPTGDLVLRTGDTGSRLLELATGAETPLGPGEDQGFVPSRDLGRSILRRCTTAGLAAVDRGVERLVVPDAVCERTTFTAWLAPLAIATDAGERCLVADLERGTFFDTGLPLVEREEPTPDGEAAYRADIAFLSTDGALLLHAQRWQVFSGDTVDAVGTGELRLVDVRNHASSVHPADARDTPIGFFRTGFVWRSDWERTHLAGAAGLLSLDRRCDVGEVSARGEHVLLSCYHESGPSYWQDHLVDTVDLSVEDLGDAWSVRTLSAGGAAIAGCPAEAWRSGGCTVPTVRRWLDGEGMRDIPLDRTADVAWVGDDGTVVAISTGLDEALVLDPRGAVRTRFPLVAGPDDRVRIQAVDDVVLIEFRGGSLDVVVPTTGSHVRLADVVASAATDGRRVAFTVAEAGGVRLRAGAIPR